MTGEISALGCAFTWALSSVFTKSLATARIGWGTGLVVTGIFFLI